MYQSSKLSTFELTYSSIYNLLDLTSFHFEDNSHLFVKIEFTFAGTMLGLNTQDQTIIDTDYAEAIDSLFALYCDRFQKVWLHLSFTFNWSAMKRKQDQLTNKLKNIINPVSVIFSPISFL